VYDAVRARGKSPAAAARGGIPAIPQDPQKFNDLVVIANQLFHHRWPHSPDGLPRLQLSVLTADSEIG
jgi:hypothetical protein